MKFSRFLVLYAAFSGLVAFSALALQHAFTTVQFLGPHFWLLFIVIAVLTGVAYGVSDLGVKKGGQLSILSLMVGLFVKLLASLVVVAALILKFPENKQINALNFFSLYLLFTVFEVMCLLRNLRDQNQT